MTSVVDVARETVPGFDEVSISVLRRKGEIETLAGTGELVWELDELQYRLDEGPSVDAIRDGSVVLVERLPNEQRWPRYVPEAAKTGLRAQLGVQLQTGEGTIGGLNFYSTTADSIGSETRKIAELFAAHVTDALSRSLYEQQLNDAISSRQVIGQALGIVMERYQIDQDRAFEYLTRASSTSNTKLRTVADEVVSTTDERFRPG